MITHHKAPSAQAGHGVDKGVQYSICMCNYNMVGTLRQAIESIAAQISDRYEILVVDDGSTDGSVELLEKLEWEIPQVRVIYLQRDSSRKLGETRNIAVQESAGMYCLLQMDCDDVYTGGITDFVNAYHELAKGLGESIYLKGNKINISTKEFLLSIGPYINIYRGEDREMWGRVIALEKFFVLQHMPIVIRGRPSELWPKFRKAVVDTYDQMLNDFRLSHTIAARARALCVQYLRWFGATQFVLRSFLIIPVCLLGLIKGGLFTAGGASRAEKIAWLSQNTRTFDGFVRKHKIDANYSGFSEEGLEIFMIERS